ncbi:MAG TPA: flippase [Chitinispirillaceae bacterium]|nr:flippase [Chitinispirillaceae bacterium]
MSNGNGIDLVRNSVFLLFNSVFMMLSTWIISIVIARLLGPEDYGIFNMTLWLSGTITWAVGMGFTHAATKFTAELKDKSEPGTIFQLILFIGKIELVASLTATILLIIFRTQIADFFFSSEQSFYFFLAALGIIPGIATAIASGVIEGLQKFKYFTYANLIMTPLSFVSKIVVLKSGYGLTGFMIVMLVFSFINTFFYLFVLYKEKVFTFTGIRLSLEIKKRILDYNKSIIAISVCDKIIWDKSENFFIGRFCQANQIAFYNLGFNIVQRFSSILPTTFWKVLFPAMSTLHGTRDTDKMKRLFYISTRYISLFSFPVGIGGIVLAYHLIHYLYGHEFIGAQRVLQIIFAASIFSNLANPGSAILYGFEKQAFIYKYGMVLAVFNIIIDLLLIKPFGAEGAAICYGITTILGSVGGLIYTCRLMKIRYPFMSILKIFTASVIMGAIMELTLRINYGIPGFVAAILIGVIVFAVMIYFMSSFEDEDLVLLEHIGNFSPQKMKILSFFLLKICRLKMRV